MNLYINYMYDCIFIKKEDNVYYISVYPRARFFSKSKNLNKDFKEIKVTYLINKALKGVKYEADYNDQKTIFSSPN